MSSALRAFFAGLVLVVAVPSAASEPAGTKQVSDAEIASIERAVREVQQWQYRGGDYLLGGLILRNLYRVYDAIDLGPRERKLLQDNIFYADKMSRSRLVPCVNCDATGVVNVERVVGRRIAGEPIVRTVRERCPKCRGKGSVVEPYGPMQYYEAVVEAKQRFGDLPKNDFTSVGSLWVPNHTYGRLDEDQIASIEALSGALVKKEAEIEKAWQQFRATVCVSCLGEGQTVCEKCHGTGKVACNRCGGSGFVVCPACKGKGIRSPSDERRCKMCKGTGQTKCPQCYATGLVLCPGCNGNAKVICKACRGVGYTGKVPAEVLPPLDIEPEP